MKRLYPSEKPFVAFLEELVLSYVAIYADPEERALKPSYMGMHEVYAIALFDYLIGHVPYSQQFHGLVVGMRMDDEVYSLAWKIYTQMKDMTEEQAVEFYCSTVNRFLDYVCFIDKGKPILPLPDFRENQKEILKTFLSIKRGNY